MPLSYWGEALTSAVYLINRVPSSTLDFQTPLQVLVEAVIAPSVPNLTPRVFGCVAYVHLHKHQRSKLAPRALRCVFLGYAAHQKGYRCYHPPSKRMFITLDVVFHEDSMYFSSESDLQGEKQKEVLTLDHDIQVHEKIELTPQEVGGSISDDNQEMGVEVPLLSDITTTSQDLQEEMEVI
ncbi:myosin-16-like, partial [Trifolium medium]|nr:myosin-16-like [Trifolium medium]